MKPFVSVGQAECGLAVVTKQCVQHGSTCPLEIQNKQLLDRVRESRLVIRGPLSW